MTAGERASILGELSKIVRELEPGNYSVRFNVEHDDSGSTVRVFTEMGTFLVVVNGDTFEIGPTEDSCAVLGYRSLPVLS